MAHTKQLLDAVDITSLIEKATVEVDVFNADDGRSVKYNYINITLTNGDEIRLKSSPQVKMALYYALREQE